MTEEEKRRLTRRQALGLMGGAALVVAVGCGDDDDDAARSTTASGTAAGTSAASAATSGTTATSGPTSAATAAPVSCVITPELTEGPYFVDERLDRSDIRSDPDTGEASEGTLLTLRLTVSQVEGEACTPLTGAVVDMWHCDAFGEYSDISGGAGQGNTSGFKFLRGFQTTDANGQVTFVTVYPGWYSGRAVHIHFKVRTDPDSNQGTEFTSQFFFDEALTATVYQASPYNQKGSPDVSNATDNIFDPAMLVALQQEGEGYAGSYHVGVAVV